MEGKVERIIADKAKGVKRLLFSPQDIKHKISINYNQHIQMKGQNNSLTDYGELTVFLGTALYTAFSLVFGRFATHPPLNNVNCVKNAVFENYFEQFSHFSTV